MTRAEDSVGDRLARVRRELARYEHPLFVFDARQAGEGVEIEIRYHAADAGIHTYMLQLRPREIDSSQFAWSFQKQLYDCLHDYVIEMFVRNPQQQN